MARPPYSGNRTLSPTATETGIVSPSLVLDPGPTAMTSPSLALDTLDSGRRMPPAVCFEREQKNNTSALRRFHLSNRKLIEAHLRLREDSLDKNSISEWDQLAERRL